MKCQAVDAGALACLSPRRSKAIGRPRAAQRVRQDKRPPAACRVKQGPQWCACRHRDPAATFRLAKANVGGLVGRPGEAQQVSLPLSAPESQDKRQLNLAGGDLENRGNVLLGPDLILAVCDVEAAATFAWVGRDDATVLRERHDTRQSCPGVVGLPIMMTPPVRRPHLPDVERKTWLHGAD